MSTVKITVGTFNLNNLFSRFNFKSEVASAEVTASAGTSVSDVKPKDAQKLKWVFQPGSGVWVRQYQGALVKPKPDDETTRIAERIKQMNVDVLAVQEVEDIDTLRGFNKHFLNGLYSDMVLIEGNDSRLIDVGILSKFPLGRVTSWQKFTYPEGSNDVIFSRDLLEVEVWDKNRQRKLFTLYNNHLKSQFIPLGADSAAAKKSSDARRTQQAEAIVKILKSHTPQEPFILLGDMNDAPNAPTLKVFKNLHVVNALTNAKETQPVKKVTPPPPTTIWTHRYGSGANAKYELFDQIWLSQSLKNNLRNAFIGRRKTLTRDGSDHDPAWIELEI
jgi:exonuclease III